MTTDRFCTGDRFRTTKIKGADWLLYLCRADDLLVHTSGEMTNPLPTEQIILAECAGLVEAACCCGNSMARPLLLLELVEGAQLDDAEIVKILEAGLRHANAAQPGYSTVLKQHVLIAEPGSLPRTVKGTVQRSKVRRLESNGGLSASAAVEPDGRVGWHRTGGPRRRESGRRPVGRLMPYVLLSASPPPLNTTCHPPNTRPPCPP